MENETSTFHLGPLSLKRTHVTVHEGILHPLCTDGVLNPSWETRFHFYINHYIIISYYIIM